MDILNRWSDKHNREHGVFKLLLWVTIPLHSWSAWLCPFQDLTPLSLMDKHNVQGLLNFSSKTCHSTTISCIQHCIVSYYSAMQAFDCLIIECSEHLRSSVDTCRIEQCWKFDYIAAFIKITHSRPFYSACNIDSNSYLVYSPDRQLFHLR